ncbi:hypothetical protein ACYULU_12345 [Breznakiellaceae bacterium SP9]
MYELLIDRSELLRDMYGLLRDMSELLIDIYELLRGMYELLIDIYELLRDRSELFRAARGSSVIERKSSRSNGNVPVLVRQRKKVFFLRKR